MSEVQTGNPLDSEEHFMGAFGMKRQQRVAPMRETPEQGRGEHYTHEPPRTGLVQ